MGCVVGSLWEVVGGWMHFLGHSGPGLASFCLLSDVFPAETAPGTQTSPWEGLRKGPGQGEAIPDLTHCTGLQSTADCHGAARTPEACFLLIPPHQSPNPVSTELLHCALYYFSVCLVVGMLVPMCSFSAHAQFCSGFCPSTWQATCLRA